MLDSLMTKGIRRLFLLSGVISCLTVACSDSGKRSVTLVGYNYTERPIFTFSVNGAGGGNAFAGYRNGGGGWVCCAEVVIDHPARIYWMYSYTKSQYEQGCREEEHTAEIKVPAPDSDKSEYLEVHFFPGNHVEMYLTDYPSKGRWPAGTKLEGPE